MIFFISAMIFIFGSAIGSFLSVVIYRLKNKKKGIFLSRSMCPHCKKKLQWHHLIPIFSWLLLKGKCSYCKTKISSNYLTLEFTTGLTFLATFISFNFITDPYLLTIYPKNLLLFVYYIIEFSLLIGIFFYDYMYQEIPDSLSIPAIILSLAKGLLMNDPSLINMTIGGVGIFLFFFIQILVSKGKWVGGGDLRLGALMGIILGWQKGLIALVIAYVLGSIIGLYLIATGKANRKSAIAFGPFLVIGTTIMIFFGDLILISYLSLLAI